MEDRVKSIIANYQGIRKEKISLNSFLIQDIGLSSFDVIGLVCEFEREFSIEVPDAEIRKVRTVNDIIQIIEKLK